MDKPPVTTLYSYDDETVKTAVSDTSASSYPEKFRDRFQKAQASKRLYELVSI